MPLISVIIPAYNVDKYVERCVHSILGQTLQDFEILLIDDGANDNTSVICDQLAEEDKRVRVYHKSNGGLSDARNYGLDRMKGRYVTFIDSDDYVSNDYLEYLYQLISEENDIQVSMLLGQSITNNEEPKESINVKEEIWSSKQAVKMMLLRNNATHTSWGKLFQAQLWDQVRFPVGLNYEDYATTYRVFSGAWKVASSNAQKYYYIQQTDSIMHQKCSEKTLSVLDVSDHETDYIIRVWPDIRIEALELQTATYLKNMQAILNCNPRSFLDYQKRIQTKVKKNAWAILTANQVPLKEKAKIIALFLGRKFFLWFYNAFDGSIKVIGN